MNIYKAQKLEQEIISSRTQNKTCYQNIRVRILELFKNKNPLAYNNLTLFYHNNGIISKERPLLLPVASIPLLLSC